MKNSITTCLVALGLVSSAVGESPYATAQPMKLMDVRWTGGFWADRFASCRNEMVPHMWDLMKGTQYKPFYEHFRRAAGLSEGDYRGAKWNDGDFYKWLQAAIVVAGYTEDDEWIGRIDEIIKVIGKAQRADGYIHTPVLIGERNGDPKAVPFGDRFAFEMYNMGHLMTTACVHHRVTGQDQFLAIARKTADFMCKTFEMPTRELARNSVCPAHYMGIIDLYRVTKEERYLELAKKLIAMRDLVAVSGEGGDDNQDRLPLGDQQEVMGHAVRANYLYAGVADLFVDTGDSKLWESLDRLWHNLIEKKMYITGGCGALYDGAAPDASKDQVHITRVHQAYGRNYQLPNTTSHNETCANIGNVLWNWRMFLASGEARFMDVVELTLYNSVLSGVSLKGHDFFYVNPLRTTDPLPVDLRWSHQRVPFVTSFCCPPNVVRTIAESAGYAYAQSEGALWVNLYGNNSLRSKEWRVRQETRYPWDGKVRCIIDQAPAESVSIKVRIPGWSPETQVRINGSEEGIVRQSGTYLDLQRYWKAGDIVELEFEMRPVLMVSHPLVEETKNHVAIKRGPIVYCLESTDLPSDVRIDDVSVPQDIQLKAQYDENLLGGVATIRGEACVKGSVGWENKLYQPLSISDTDRTISAQFIPYYAWANRGKSEMTVWLPLAVR